MSNERDELIKDIQNIPVRSMGGPPVDLAGPLAQHLIELGYRKPRTIMSIGAIGQREGMVILTADGRVMVYLNGHWQMPDSKVWWQPLVDWLPATVLYEAVTP